MNVNFETKAEADGSYTVVIVFSGVPDAKQATTCQNVVKRALLIHDAVDYPGAAGPLARKH